MNVLEKILEEIIDELKEEGIIADDVRGNLAVNIIRSHMDHSGDDTEMDGWIPVSERLPEEGEKCIITDKDGYVHDNIIYDYANVNEKPSFHRWDDEYWQCFRPDVIAWQPLPEPYRPEEG